MKNRKKNTLVVCLVLIVFAITCNLLDLTDAIINNHVGLNALFIAEASCSIFLMLTAAAYLLCSFTSVSARFLKIFLYVFIGYGVAMVLGYVVFMMGAPLLKLLKFASLTMLGVLFCFKNTNRKIMKTLLAIAFVCSIFAAIYSLCALTINAAMMIRIIKELLLMFSLIGVAFFKCSCGGFEKEQDTQNI